ncbi:MAG TPA: glycerol-3-phosphate dehydrogenase [Burkholderiales bacterium]|nr:glycerol-3-phosphate dehydrogenase [Burkholderiales bacterium]
MEADILIVGGGINGVGIARDAAGRGLAVVLVEQADLGSATSSASSKLVHGGLRYLEQLELRLVAESLHEREVLLRAAPHIVRPMRFVMPSDRALRPAWVIRSGLYLYDWLARRDTLEASSSVDLARPPYRDSLQPRYRRGYAYSDCWVDDARLVIANARAAADLGAQVLTGTRCVEAKRHGPRWRARLSGHAGDIEVRARALVNATGPWVERFITGAIGEPTAARVKLVQGSHIVVPRLYEGDHAFILQNDDRRVVFVYGYEGDTLIGTTDVARGDEPGACAVSAAEVEYLCRAANRYFARQSRPADVKWSYCGVRALVDDGSSNPSKVTRDYLLQIDGGAQRPPLLSVFGGKITTYRKLAERALEKLRPALAHMQAPWTAAAVLPGGDVPSRDPESYARSLCQRYRALPERLVRALVQRHGTRAPDILDAAYDTSDLGEHFGADLYAREVDYFITHEWARDVEDILWRRTKAGLHITANGQARLAHYLHGRLHDAAMR